MVSGASAELGQQRAPGLRVGLFAAFAFIATLLLAAIPLTACGGDDEPPAIDDVPAPNNEILNPGGLNVRSRRDPPGHHDPHPASTRSTCRRTWSPWPSASHQVELIDGDRDPRSMAMLVADTFDRRTRGLMFRDGLPSNTGMLFAFPAPTNGPVLEQGCTVRFGSRRPLGRGRDPGDLNPGRFEHGTRDTADGVLVRS